MTTRKDLSGFVQGAYVRRALYWKQPSGAPVDLTDRSFAASIRYTPGDPVHFDFDCTVDGPTGALFLVLPRLITITMPAGMLWWDLWEITVVDEALPVLTGRVPVKRRVTVV